MLYASPSARETSAVGRLRVCAASPPSLTKCTKCAAGQQLRPTCVQLSPLNSRSQRDWASRALQLIKRHFTECRTDSLGHVGTRAKRETKEIIRDFFAFPLRMGRSQCVSDGKGYCLDRRVYKQNTHSSALRALTTAHRLIMAPTCFTVYVECA